MAIILIIRGLFSYFDFPKLDSPFSEKKKCLLPKVFSQVSKLNIMPIFEHVASWNSFCLHLFIEIQGIISI